MRLMPHQQIRILHVDNDPAFADLTATYLKRDDDRSVVETATCADEGLTAIADCPPDCVVSDYNMPGMNGLEFLQAVREEYSDLPFILVTGEGGGDVASDAISAGVTDYLQKDTGTSQYTVLANRTLDPRLETRVCARTMYWNSVGHGSTSSRPEADDAVERGGEGVTVTVGAIDDGFFVADTGPGVPESEREDVFEAGYSTDEDGTGFGLRIVEQIAEAHGWDISVTESDQGGARFEVTGVERMN